MDECKPLRVGRRGEEGGQAVGHPESAQGRGLHSSSFTAHLKHFLGDTLGVSRFGFSDENGSGRADKWTGVSPCHFQLTSSTFWAIRWVCHGSSDETGSC